MAGAEKPKKNRPWQPSSHRSQSDDEAHAQAAGSTPARHRHPLVADALPQFINEQGQLLALVTELRQAGSFAYDSEFIGELTYVPKLCLIQAASTKQIALIDPLAGLDLAPFWELVADRSVEKIVHAGQQDVEPVFRLISKPPANLFDTQIGGGFMGLGYPLSLSKLVQAVLGFKLSKGLTFTHWDRRPLSELQLRYAADDVRYLPAVRQEMARQLSACGHERWAAEASEQLAEATLHCLDPETHLFRIRGAGSLSPMNLAVLRELAMCRDKLARQDDVPPRSLLKDEVLLEMARRPVRSADLLSRVRGLPRPVQAAHGAELVAATLQAMALPADQWPTIHSYEASPREKFATDGLWAAVQAMCLGRGIDPNLVTGRNEIAQLYRLLRGGKSVEEMNLMKGWRREAVGEAVLAFVAGQSELRGVWREGTLSVEAK